MKKVICAALLCSILLSCLPACGQGAGMAPATQAETRTLRELLDALGEKQKQNRAYEHTLQDLMEMETLLRDGRIAYTLDDLENFGVRYLMELRRLNRDNAIPEAINLYIALSEKKYKAAFARELDEAQDIELILHFLDYYSLLACTDSCDKEIIAAMNAIEGYFDIYTHSAIPESEELERKLLLYANVVPCMRMATLMLQKDEAGMHRQYREQERKVEDFAKCIMASTLAITMNEGCEAGRMAGLVFDAMEISDTNHSAKAGFVELSMGILLTYQQRGLIGDNVLQAYLEKYPYGIDCMVSCEQREGKDGAAIEGKLLSINEEEIYSVLQADLLLLKNDSVTMEVLTKAGIVTLQEERTDGFYSIRMQGVWPGEWEG